MRITASRGEREQLDIKWLENKYAAVDLFSPFVSDEGWLRGVNVCPYKGMNVFFANNKVYLRGGLYVFN